MKLFNNVDDYLQEAKENDIIVFGGNGIIDGLKNINSKHDTYKVCKNTNLQKIVVRGFRGRKNLTLGADSYDQKLVLLNNMEFKNLPVLW